MKSSIKKLLIVGLAVFWGTSQSFSQEYDAEISVIGQVFSQSNLTGSGNITFQVSVDNSTNPVGIPAGELKVLFSFPQQILLGAPVIQNTTTVPGSWPPSNSLVPADYAFSMTMTGSNEGYFQNAVNLPAATLGSTYYFTIPYGLSGPIPTPVGYSVKVELDFIFGEGTNTLTYTAPFATFIANNVMSTNPVPVTFNHFTATAKSCEAQLEWSVAKELGAEQYLVERSADGRSFETIGAVAYNSNAKGVYSFVDEKPLSGNNLYRIAGVDPDGTKVLTDVQRITMDCEVSNIAMFPNPTSSGVKLSGLKAGQRITLFDLTGRMLINTKAQGEEANLDLSNYAAAMYKVIVTTAEGTVIFNNKLSKH